MLADYSKPQPNVPWKRQFEEMPTWLGGQTLTTILGLCDGCLAVVATTKLLTMIVVDFSIFSAAPFLSEGADPSGPQKK